MGDKRVYHVHLPILTLNLGVFFLLFCFSKAQKYTSFGILSDPVLYAVYGKVCILIFFETIKCNEFHGKCCLLLFLRSSKYLHFNYYLTWFTYSQLNQKNNNLRSPLNCFYFLLSCHVNVVLFAVNSFENIIFFSKSYIL